ncbi:Hypothetical predicted protein [Paramuricea clavata]|uniref:Uncharacterized protein n=2 Tax=Paramuricea clavata TaxID=317549 RepID=A0A6S7H1D1_PARCT|nr:Hypothetical predicted protein [Paramuricea clavata]
MAAEAYHVYHFPFSFATAQHYSPYCNVKKPTSSPISAPGPAAGYHVDEQPNVPDINNQGNRSAGRCPEKSFYDDRKIHIHTISKNKGAIGGNNIITNQYGMSGQYVRDVGEEENPYELHPDDANPDIPIFNVPPRPSDQNGEDDDLYEPVPEDTKAIVSTQDVSTSHNTVNASSNISGDDIRAVSTQYNTNEEFAGEAKENGMMNEQETRNTEKNPVEVYDDRVKEENSSSTDDLGDEIVQDDVAFNIGCEGHVQNLIAKFSSLN